MKRPRLLDLFCGAGGAAMGYHLAGFDVVGVDIAPQPNYPFTFHKGDALEFVSTCDMDYEVIHASPPCQAYSAFRVLTKKERPDLYSLTRAMIPAWMPYVIENVIGAPYRSGVVLCGSMFGLPFRRHRNFESSIGLLAPSCRHDLQTSLLGIYGASDGYHPPGFKHPGRRRGPRQVTTPEARALMNMPWATRAEITQAIPPVFSEFIGRQLMQALGKKSLG